MLAISNFYRFPRQLVLGFMFLTGIFVANVALADIEGFSEPFRTIEMASDETGTISELLVKEGDRLSSGEAIVRLDDRIQRLKVELAQHLVDSNSAMVAARRTFEKREMIAKRIHSLREKGHASESEVIRSEMELSIAKAKYLAAQEDAAARRIELRRTQVELDRRTIVAPFDCLVSFLHHDEGEFLSPLHPEVATLIQVDQMLAVFPVPASQVHSLSIGQEMTVQFENGPTVNGQIHSIGVTNDAQSDTVKIKVKVDNKAGNLRGGQRCLLKL